MTDERPAASGTAPRIRYLVIAHHRPTLFQALLEALGDSPVVAHIDRKTDDAPFRSAIAGRANTLLLDERHDVRWGGWSQVAAMLALVRAALEEAENDDRLVLLSGDSFPLRGPEGITSFFAEHATDQFLDARPMPDADAALFGFGSLTRLSRLQFEVDPASAIAPVTRLMNRARLPRPYRRALGGRAPYGGSQWWALTADAARELLAAGSDSRLVRMMRHSTVPDEQFAQIAIMGTRFAADVVDSLMWVDWAGGSGGSPATIAEKHVEDLQAVTRAGTSLFTRKLADEATPVLIRDVVWPAGWVDAS